ncbi:MAG TPA: ATP-dependent zinc metalloprotease FtsH [Polyangiaceae bacterium]|jgi:cell division protease FtsH
MTLRERFKSAPFTPIILLGLLFVGLWIARASVHAPSEKTVNYSELVADVNQDKVARVEIRPDAIVATLRADKGKPEPIVEAERPPNLDDRTLLESLRQHSVEVTGHPEEPSIWGPIFWSLLPLLLIVPFIIGIRRAGAAAGRSRPMTFGRSKAKLYDRSQESNVTFDDVAGVEEAKGELTEIVSFLKEPKKYTDIGARVPKGVLLVGPPGTGKTLLARAVAGESGVPFYSISGSEFVEMFVGVGASRVRDLFEQAKERGPCIIFIDELDAIGKARSGIAGFASNEEREQTLNQLLIEMDGFDSATGLIIMAATNRPEILDKALLRAGRFDRQVVLDRPDVRGREAILRVHVRKVKLGADVELKVIAQRTPGMVGADLANVINEAALASVRHDRQIVTAADFEEAIDRIQLGLKKEGRVMTEDDKRRVAFHEAGHALVALSMAKADPVHRVTIIPRSVGALGATLQLPTEERYLMTRGELRDRLCVLMGGRAAEELVFRDASTGAEDDISRATAIARQMIARFGMSEELGPVSFMHPETHLSGEPDFASRDFSEETARTIDDEVKATVTREAARAREVLTRRRATLEAVARELIQKETLERDQLEAIVRTAETKNGHSVSHA